MFTVAELLVIRKALVLSAKSIERLSRKDGQPDAVVKAFVLAHAEVNGVISKLDGEIAKVKK